MLPETTALDCEATGLKSMLQVDVQAAIGRFALACDLRVEAGHAVALVGASGAGKTSALRAIAGLVRPQRGSILYGKECWSDSERHIFVPPQGRSCGFVFAEYALFGHLTAFENVAFGMRACGTARSFARTRARELMERFGVLPLAGRAAASLSSGEMQRVAIARALATSPAVLLLDEPLSAIDVERRPPVREALLRHIVDSGTATVVVTHDPVEAMLFADQLIVLERGAVVQRGSASELRERPRSSYVAAFSGVNLYQGTAHPEAGGVSIVQINGTPLTILGSWTGHVAVVIDPDSIVLSKARPDSSARNCLIGPVIHAFPDGSAVRVSIASSPPIVARITSQSAADLEIKPGADVVATFKASEMRVH